MQHYTSQQAQTTRYIIQRNGHQKTLWMTLGSASTNVTTESANVQDSGPDARYVWSQVFRSFCSPLCIHCCQQLYLFWLSLFS